LRRSCLTFGPNSSRATPSAPLAPWFNRGTISAQWLSRAIGTTPKATQTLEKAIATKSNKIRDFLMGALGARLLGLLAKSQEEHCDTYVALHELNDPELIKALVAMKGKAHVVLGNPGKKMPPQRKPRKRDRVEESRG
jgi:hypothetical protein